MPVSYKRTVKSHMANPLLLATAGILFDIGHSTSSSYNPDQAGSSGNSFDAEYPDTF
jgi:hypothetical protein